MDLGIIGNCRYSALIDRRARVRWLCWPRFDSSFVFGSLLDETLGGEFSIHSPDDGLGKQTYLSNTNVLQTVFETETGAFEVLDFAPRFMQNDTFHKPTMLVRILRPLRGEPQVLVRCKPRYDYGKIELKAVVGSNRLQFAGAPAHLSLTTDMSIDRILEERPFLLQKPQYFVLAWGEELNGPIDHTCEDLLDRTIKYWQRWVKHCALPGKFQSEVIRSALTLKLHQFEDTGAVIAATTTSIPEAAHTPRTWDYRYCWLRDAYFTIMALQRLSHFEELEAFEQYLKNVAEASLPDRLQPVYGISGEMNLDEHQYEYLAGYEGNKPVRVGNAAYLQIQNDLYGEMILAISPLLLDIRFFGAFRELPRRLLDRLVNNVESTLEDHDAGIWEYRGVKQTHTFSLLMHWAGASKAMEIARRINDAELFHRCEKLAARARQVIDSTCWNPKLQIFGDAVGSSNLDASLIMMINLGYFGKDDPRALPHLENLVKGLSFSGGLLRRYKHTDDFGETDNAFLVCSFWLVEAYARLGLHKKAEHLFEKLLKLGNHLGLYSEDIEPHTGVQWGNFPQTYSHVGLINSAFALAPPY